MMLPREEDWFVSKRGLNKSERRLGGWRLAAMIFLPFITSVIRSLGASSEVDCRTKSKTWGFEWLWVKTKGMSFAAPSCVQSLGWRRVGRSMAFARCMPLLTTWSGYCFCFKKRLQVNSSSLWSCTFSSEIIVQMRRAREYGIFVNVRCGWKEKNGT